MNTSTAHIAAAAISRAHAASQPQPTAFGPRQRTAAAKKRSRKAWPSLALTVWTRADGTAYVSWTLGPTVEEVREVLGGCFESAIYTRSTGEMFLCN